MANDDVISQSASSRNLSSRIHKEVWCKTDVFQSFQQEQAFALIERNLAFVRVGGGVPLGWHQWAGVGKERERGGESGK
jgi:hypothetical protein